MRYADSRKKTANEFTKAVHDSVRGSSVNAIWDLSKKFNGGKEVGSAVKTVIIRAFHGNLL